MITNHYQIISIRRLIIKMINQMKSDTDKVVQT